MKNILRAACAALAVSSATSLFAAGVLEPAPVQTSSAPMLQAAAPAPVAAPVAAPAVAFVPAPAPAVPVFQTQNAVLRAGAPVSLRLLEEITTKKKAARVGQRFTLEVAAPVEVNGVVVIPAGTPAWGEITSVRNKGMWGKSGKLEARLLYLRVNGRQIRLTGNFDDKGVTGTAGVVGAVAFVPIAGFFLTGTSATFPMGGSVNGFIDEDVELAFKQAAPAPLQVQAAPPVMEVAATPATPAPTAEPVAVAAPTGEEIASTQVQ